ncbi:MAG TPA: radical SAM protein, partial [Ignavibacteria bacterium]|nr:radical SAM protein [Ignavibacteria bacterium]
MKLITSTGKEELAVIYIAQAAGGNYVEFVESLQPPKAREEKWILTVSTLYGCPVDCLICDAGPYYLGRISKEGIFWQIDHMISKRYPDGNIPVKQLKIHFTRMGEPAFNFAVLDVIREFDLYFKAPGFMPSISSIAPRGSEKFFEELLVLKNEKFCRGNFQLQFSIHTTNESKRNDLIPVKKWSFERIADYGARFHGKRDRKITLSFAPAIENEIEPEVLYSYFSPEHFLIKLTPLNLTNSTIKNNFTSVISP